VAQRERPVGLVLAGVVVAAAIVASFGGTPYDPQFQNAAALLQHPTWSHPFGTDQFAATSCRWCSTASACPSRSPAWPLRSRGDRYDRRVVAGFLGRWTSAVIMRVTDMMFAIPAILLALIVVAALGPDG